MSQDQYNLLLEAYSDKNLNSITAKIIELYKTKEFDILREIVNKISEYVSFSDESISKCFSQLVMLYHPDKGVQIRKEIEKIGLNGNQEQLKRYSHILLVKDIEKIIVSKAYEIDEEFTPEYSWDKETTGYEYYTEEREFSDSDNNTYDEENIDNSFFSAVKRKFYGFLDIDLPFYYLEDHEEIEMTSYEIEDLDGIQYCKHVRELNLSNNFINDISEIQSLKELEELYISNNQIGYIDALIACNNLRVIDISMNNIDDVSALFNLPKIEFVNLIGNDIPQEQIKRLISNDVIVIS
jgi:Leucine Rich repeats (2 copies)